MVSPKEIRERICSKGNEDLIGMLANERLYTADAVDCVKAELLRRKIDPKDFQTVFGQMVMAAEETEQRANAELALPIKVALVLFPFLFVFGSPILILFFPDLEDAMRFHEDGFRKKSSQVFNYTLMGGILWLGAGILWHFRYVLFAKLMN